MLAGFCSYRDIKDSRIDLCDIATLNELIDLKNLNEGRMIEHERRRRAMERR